jgi:23S rRNA pseudouridine1911/1915/1917 synthase
MPSIYPEILYEDNHLLIVNKRPGQLVQGDKTGDEPLSEILKRYIKEKYNKPGDVFLGVIHRLDRPVSGVVIFARTSKALARMNEKFKKKEVQKTYWAVVDQAPKQEAAQLTHYLIKDQKKNKSRAVDPSNKTALQADLYYKALLKLNNYYLLEISPLTGRHHQIRVQLSSSGMIIKGDLKYGAKRSNRDASIHLHARRIQFEHPVRKEPMMIEASPPSDPIWDDVMKELS